MRIVCPNCDTAYDAPESVVAAGRLMRCARCRTEWAPGAPAELAPLPIAVGEPAFVTGTVTAPSTEPMVQSVPDPLFARRVSPPPEPAEGEPYIHAPFPILPDPPKGHRRIVIAAWAASVVGLVAALWLAIAFRQPIMRHWPASARAYAALGYR